MEWILACGVPQTCAKPPIRLMCGGQRGYRNDMKKQLLIAFTVLFILPCAFWPATEGPSAQVSYLPDIPYEFSDLDARDSQNNLIQSSVGEPSLTGLFMGNLFDLTVKIESHGMRDLFSGINYFSRLFKDTFFTCMVVILAAIHEALEPKQKRFVHNVHNLWITPFVGIFLLFMTVQISRCRSSCLAVTLRC